MFDSLKRLLRKGRQPRFTREEYERHYALKQQGLERVLGPMHKTVGHAIIGFEVGGPVDMYYFPNAMDGTGFATMELLAPDGSGPRPSSIGTYELVAFTKHKVDDPGEAAAFEQINLHMWHILTTVGRYSLQAELNPLETVEVPAGEGQPYRCLILDEYARPGVDFKIGGRKHGLLLLVEVFRREMEYAMKNGAPVVLEKLKQEGYYPYSDLEREPVL